MEYSYKLPKFISKIIANTPADFLRITVNENYLDGL